MARVAHVGDREAVRKHVPDKGMALMDHDLYAVAAPLLIAVPDKLDVARGNRGHGTGSSVEAVRDRTADRAAPVNLRDRMVNGADQLSGGVDPSPAFSSPTGK